MAYREGADRLRFVRTGEGTDVDFQVDPLAIAVVSSLDRVGTFEELWSAVGSVPGFSVEGVDEILEVLRSEHLSRPADVLDDADTGEDRYDRQLRLFREWLAVGAVEAPAPDAVQARLETAAVSVIGIGGLGGSVARLLTMAGVGSLTLCDPDVVEVTNLTRQSLFSVDDVGRRKLQAAADRLGALNPGVELTLVEDHLDAVSDLTALIEGVDIVINCADTPSIHATSDWIAAACMPSGVPHLVGGGYGFRFGTLPTMVVPGRTACWQCVRRATAGDVAEPDAVLLRATQRPVGVVAALSDAMAGFIALDVVSVLTGRESALADRIVEFDPVRFSLDARPIQRDRSCPACVRAEVAA